MAALDITRVRLLPGFVPKRAPLPSIGVTVDEYGRRTFEIQTSQGAIKVTLSPWGWEHRGSKQALINFGLISESWLPGAPGNNKTRQTVLFMPDGQVALGYWKGRRPSGYPTLSIARHSGRTFTVIFPYTDEEQAEYDNFKSALKKEQEQERVAANAARQAWTKAKHATDPDEAFAVRWRNGVLNMIQKVASLVDGKVAFKDFPNFRLAGDQLDEAKDLVSQLEKAMRESRPTLPIVKIRSNVIGLDRRAYEYI